MLWPHGNFLEILAVIPSIILAFNFQYNLFSLYYSLKEPNPKDMMRSCWIGIIFVAFINISVGLLSYLIYGDDLNGWVLPSIANDLEKYKQTNTAMFVVLIFLCFGLVSCSSLSIPILFCGLKKNVINTVILIKKQFLKNNNKTDLLKNTNTFDKDIIDKITNEYLGNLNTQTPKKTAKKKLSYEIMLKHSNSDRNMNRTADIPYIENRKNTSQYFDIRSKKTFKSTFTKKEQLKVEEKIQEKYLSNNSKYIIIVVIYLLVILMTILIKNLSTVSIFFVFIYIN